MVQECVSISDAQSTEDWLSNAEKAASLALEKARAVRCFLGRWQMIISKLEKIPTCLSDLSSHPCFSKNSLCKEQLQAVSRTLTEVLDLAERCVEESYSGKLQMQSDLDVLYTKIDLNFRDCGLLTKTGVLGESTLPLSVFRTEESEPSRTNSIRELLARLQIGDIEAKHCALDSLIEAMKLDQRDVLSVLGHNNVSALIHLLTAATSPRIREKIATLICSIAESGYCDKILAFEGIVPSLIRLAESGSSLGKEKVTIALQRLSVSAEMARFIVGHGGSKTLIEICESGSSVSQIAAAGTLKNLSALPELRQNLADDGIIATMIDLLNNGSVPNSQEYAAECLLNLTSSNEILKGSVAAEGGIQCLVAYINRSSPQECAVGALRNLIGTIPIEVFVSLGILPCLIHVLKTGSLGAKQAAASAICKLCIAPDLKKPLGEIGALPLLVDLLEAKSNNAREVAARAVYCLMGCLQNCRELKKNPKSVPNLVQLLDSHPQNTAKKYAVTCLVSLSSSKKCKKLMISHGAIGYLKKLCDMGIPGAKKLLDRLERRKLPGLFRLSDLEYTSS